MKKIYLLSAAACLFAFSAKAENVWYADGGASEQGACFTMEQVSGTLGTNGPVAKVAVSKAGATGDPWAVQFCNIFKEAARGQAEGKTFKMSFEVLYAGASTEGVAFSFLTGKQHNEKGVEMHANWQWNAPDAAENPNQELNNVTFAVNGTALEGDPAAGVLNKGLALEVGKWNTIEVNGTIGAAGMICIQMNLGGNAANEGAFFFKNMDVTFNKDVVKFFEDKAADNTAIAEEAAVKAYVANNVIFASEAADVVVYNINGVAVKSAKNVTSLNVADLKAGLYIAKVGNTTVKFVK
jgi:hypothetical protein